MLPSEWAIVEISWGEGRKHLYSPDRQSLVFYPTYDKAMAAAQTCINDGTEMVAILAVNKLLKRKTPVEVEIIS